MCFVHIDPNTYVACNLRKLSPQEAGHVVLKMSRALLYCDGKQMGTRSPSSKKNGATCSVLLALSGMAVNSLAVFTRA